MRPAYVEMIVAIAETGSLGAAAARLGRSQPALSKALKAAEQEIGAQVFHRGAQGALPTAEGQRIITRCQRILRDLRALDEDIAQTRGAVTGRVGVVVSPLAAMRIVPPALGRFRRRWPGVTVDVMGGHAPKAFHALHTAEADFVVGPGPLRGMASGLVAEPLVSTGITLLTGRGARFAGCTDPAALADADWAMIGPPTRRAPYLDALAAKGLTARLPVVRAESILSVLTILEQSDLVCSFPSLVLPEVLRRWQVEALPLDLGAPPVEIALTRAKDRILTPAAQAFADLMRDVGRGLVPPPGQPQKP